MNYSVPKEPEYSATNVADVQAQLLDVRDDIENVEKTMHNQWEQFCNDISSVKDNVNKLFIMIACLFALIFIAFGVIVWKTL